MLLTPHILTGAVIASKISNPFLVIPLAVLSHYILDLIPHDDYLITNIKEKRWNKSFPEFLKIFSDIALGILLISVFSQNNLIIFAGAFAAIMPDAVTLVAIIFPQNPLFNIHQKLHMAVNKVSDRGLNKKISLFWAIFNQVTVTLIAIYLLR